MQPQRRAQRPAQQRAHADGDGRRGNAHCGSGTAGGVTTLGAATSPATSVAPATITPCRRWRIHRLYGVNGRNGANRGRGGGRSRFHTPILRVDERRINRLLKYLRGWAGMQIGCRARRVLQPIAVAMGKKTNAAMRTRLRCCTPREVFQQPVKNASPRLLNRARSQRSERAAPAQTDQSRPRPRSPGCPPPETACR